MREENYIEVNRASWNKRVAGHLASEFYDVDGFLAGKSSLNEIELSLLGDVAGKRVLHLQCHFGQDTISLERMGAIVTGVDLSDKAIDAADKLARQAQSQGRFICSDVYDLPQVLNEKFDVVFTSYGTIGWLPDIERWANVVEHFLAPGGQFVFAEFHPVVWMFDSAFEDISFSYFKQKAIIETEAGSYATKDSTEEFHSITWNHSLSSVVNALLKTGLQLSQFTEYDYSPHDCFNGTVETSPGKYRIKHLGDKLPMVYALLATKASAS